MQVDGHNRVVPELPDVEGYRRELAQRLPGRRVRHVHVEDAGVLRNATAQSFAQRLAGRRFDTPGRHGKWLLLPTDGPTLIVHSGMTGRPFWTSASVEIQPYLRVRIELDEGELRYTDLRKLRGLWVADTREDESAIVGRSGPDALDLGLAQFAAALSTKRRLKTALTDQAVLAGLGNLLSDEVCWQARIHPMRPCPQLSQYDITTLHATTRRVLRTSVRHHEVPHLRGWLTRVRGDRDAACPRCGTPLMRTRNAGRTAVWCPHCQPR